MESVRNFPRTLLRVSSNDVETFVNSAKDSPRTFLKVSAKDFKAFANSARDLPRTFRGGPHRSGCSTFNFTSVSALRSAI